MAAEFNASEIIEKFHMAMANHGIVVTEEIIADSKLHRIHVEGDRKGVRNGWYILHLDGKPAGAFGCNKRHGASTKFTWSSKSTKPLTPEERREFRKRMDEQRAQRAEQDRQRREAAAANAQRMWDNARDCTDHPYLERKGVKPHGLRVGVWQKVDPETGELFIVSDRALLIPIRDAKKRIHSLQAIFPAKKGDRDKDFVRDGAKAGMFYSFGKPRTVEVGGEHRKVIIIGEGYATLASVHEATGHACIVAFDAGNLAAVAKIIRGCFPDAVLVLLADNDQWTKAPINNPGMTKAMEAAREVSALLAVPPFSQCEGEKGSDGKMSGPTDFNDWHQRFDLDGVRALIEAAIEDGARPARIVLAPTGDEARNVAYAHDCLVRMAKIVSNRAACVPCVEDDTIFLAADGDLERVAAIARMVYPEAAINILAAPGQVDEVRCVAAKYCASVSTPPSADGWRGWGEYFLDLLFDRIDECVNGELTAGTAAGDSPVASLTCDSPRDIPQKSKASKPTFGQPVDLFNVQPVPQIPLDVLPLAIARYAKDQAELMGCDHSIIAMSTLAAAASCLHDEIRIQVKRHDSTWRESARLWVAVVGSPSTKKSPAIAKAVQHVKSIDQSRREKGAADYANWSGEHTAWKKASKSHDGEAAAPEPQRPPTKRAIVEDVTVEALSEILVDNEQGLLCVRDELTGWLGSMDAYKGGRSGGGSDRANWIELYNGGQRSIDRVTRGSIFIPNWSACLIGGIQPDMMRRAAASMGNDGLLQRFIPVVASHVDSIGVDRAPDMDAIDQYRDLFQQLAATQPNQSCVQLEEAAHIVRERVDLHAAKIARAIGHDGMEAWLGKWSGLFARLLLVYHAIQCATEHVHPTSRLVSGVTAEQVERLLCGTILRHAINFYSEIIDVHDRQERARELGRLILAKGWDVVSKRDLQRSWKAAAKMENWQLHDVVNRLCDMDWLQPDRDDEPGADGKPRTWFVNPAAHHAYKEYAYRERLRRAEVVETLRKLKAEYQYDTTEP